MTTTDFPALRRTMGRSVKGMQSALPATMRGFGDLHRAALADGAVSAKTKELVALGISIAVHCEACIAFHVHDALEAGATRTEIEEVIGVAVLMAGGPGVMYGGHAYAALEQFEAEL